MYVVTFYSFKGGVGRTMALVNTAALLAASGKRVLVVDFDLEAPSLPSYEPFAAAEGRVGLVDYVSAYRATGMAPDAGDYIVEARLGEVPLWLMPAGRHTERGYNEALNSIDWQQLYDLQDGYLMIEDLRQQWRHYQGRGFDYVLIDSRTGHTDVGGICTRQLPDAVVIMFVPNGQNIEGLVPIVAAIKQERDIGYRSISLHFCPSNVPDLDDDKDILRDKLAAAQEKLGYKDRDVAAMVHHYSSLDLLKQTAFTMTRRTTRLSREFQDLKTAIIAANVEDPEGARVALERMPADYERARQESDDAGLAAIQSAAQNIRARHPNDGQLALLASRVFAKLGDSAKELEALTTAIESGHEVTRARIYRGQTYALLGNLMAALQDMRAVLSARPDRFEVVPAIQMLFASDKDWASALIAAFARDDLDFNTINEIANWLLTDRGHVDLVAARMRSFLGDERLGDRERTTAINQLTLALIAGGKFAEAVVYLTAEGRKLTLPDRFNLAIAEWGQTGEPRRDLFAAFEKTPIPISNRSSANVQQCVALARALLGEREAAIAACEEARSQAVGGLMFSCWRYLYVQRAEFLADLAAMSSRFAAGDEPEPAFFAALRPQLL